jgi:hypothetical protein
MLKGRWFPPYDPKTHEIDHKFSIWAGFNAQVPIEVISGKRNLQLMSKEDNQAKWSSCSITLQELYEAYIPDDDVDEVVNVIMATDDEDTLTRWALFAHEYLKAA